MSVLIEAISVVLRNSTIEGKYRGGLSKYEQDANATFCTDGHIARVGFMVPADAARFVMDLEKRGFLYTQDDQCIDIAVVPQSGEFRFPCDWLVVQRRSDGVAFCSLKGAEASELAVPSGWTPQDPWAKKLEWDSNENYRNRLQYLRKDGNVEVYLDKQTRKEVYLGRAYQDSPGVTSFTDYYGMGVELVHPYIEFAGEERQMRDIHGPDRRRIVEQGIEYLRIATIAYPEPGNWPAYWYLGKTYQALRDHAKAYSFFMSAFRIHPNEEVVCRELARECLELGKNEEGLSIAQIDAKLCPDDAAVLCNLGLALFLNGDLKAATRVIQQSLEQAPGDPIPKNLLAMIAQVESGKRKQPRTLADLQKRG